MEGGANSEIPNKWHKEDAETRHFSHLLGIFRKQDASILSNIDAAL